MNLVILVGGISLWKILSTPLHIKPICHNVFYVTNCVSFVKASPFFSIVVQAVKLYSASIQQTLAILFLKGGREFITSTDSVSRDSAERTLIAWDYQTTARLSNQIFHVSRRLCVSLGSSVDQGPGLQADVGLAANCDIAAEKEPGSTTPCRTTQSNNAHNFGKVKGYCFQHFPTRTY